MSMRVGVKGQTYYNAGTYAQPEWVRAKCIKDLSFEISKTEVQIKNKGSDWVKYLTGLKDLPLDFESDYNPNDPVSTAIMDAFWTEEPLEFLILDDKITKQGAQGLRAGFIVTKGGRNEPVDDMMTMPSGLRLAADWPHEPAYVMVGAGGALTILHGGDE